MSISDSWDTFCAEIEARIEAARAEPDDVWVTCATPVEPYLEVERQSLTCGGCGEPMDPIRPNGRGRQYHSVQCYGRARQLVVAPRQCPCGMEFMPRIERNYEQQHCSVSCGRRFGRRAA